MYLFGFSLDNLSLMALTIATGFVVDDAVVVLENITRHMEAGMPRLQAALVGAREVGFTVLSMSLSLIAVFLPILLMGGIVGRLFREFSVTLSVAILISLAVSLSTTPMMCARLLRHDANKIPSRFAQASQRAFDAVHRFYERTLRAVLAAPGLTIFTLFATVCLNVFLYIQVPKGFFPSEDTGRLIGGVRADQSISFQAMSGEDEIPHAHRQAGSGHRHRGRLHRRRPQQRRLHVRLAQAAGRARRHLHRRRDQPPAPEAEPRAGRQPVPAGGAGPAFRRPPEQFDLPVHAAQRRSRMPCVPGRRKSPTR